MCKCNILSGGFLLCSLLALTACQQPIDLPVATLNDEFLRHSRIEATENATRLTPERLVDKLSQATLLIIGEEHTNAEHHLIEQWLMERLTQYRPQGSVLMEMISISQQPLIAEVRRAIKSGSYLRESRIQELLQWNNGWPWRFYRGLVLSALKRDSLLIAASLSEAQTRTIYQAAQFPPGEKAGNQKVRDALAAAIMAMHGGDITPQRLTGMLAVQQHRDRFMAEQLLRAPRPALLFAGGFHAAKDTGVPLHLQDLHGEKPVVLILAAYDMSVSSEQADYVWYTPAPVP